LTSTRQTHSLVFVIGILTLLVAFAALHPYTSNAAIAWADDFNDGDLDGWTVSQGNFTAADNSLRATEAGWNFAIHSSTVAYGTWIFDVEATETTDDHFYVYIISYIGSNYRFSVFTDVFPGWTEGDEFTLLKQQGATTISIAEYVPTADITGWYHFEVHRNETGHFEIYINGILRMQVVDNDITQSSSFQFGTQIGPGIDNIEIHDLSDAPPTTPPAIPGFPWLTIFVAISLALCVVLWLRKSRS